MSAPLLGVLLALATILAGPLGARADEPRLILGTTVGLARTGLLDTLAPLFERHSGRRVTTVAVSGPQALTLGALGELDVLLLDAPDSEAPYVAAGHVVDRRLVMHADAVILGPRDDPARASSATTPDEALRRIAASDRGWVSRADNSGFYRREQQLWREAGVDPTGQPWYVELQQGMAPALVAATERQSYTLADRFTYLEHRDSLDLTIVVEGTPDLLHLYHVLAVNPAKGARIDEAGARAFADFLLDPGTQALIQAFGVERFGQPVFVPDGGRTEHDVRPARRPAA
jgi:tungstate transport system substrate-binding protein